MGLSDVMETCNPEEEWRKAVFARSWELTGYLTGRQEGTMGSKRHGCGYSEVGRTRTEGRRVRKRKEASICGDAGGNAREQMD